MANELTVRFGFFVFSKIELILNTHVYSVIMFVCVILSFLSRQKLSITTTFTEDTKGIPDFWYQIFRNVYMLSELIEKHDEPVLKYLVDVKVEYTKDPMVFVLYKSNFEYIIEFLFGNAKN